MNDVDASEFHQPTGPATVHVVAYIDNDTEIEPHAQPYRDRFDDTSPATVLGTLRIGRAAITLHPQDITAIDRLIAGLEDLRGQWLNLHTDLIAESDSKGE